MKKNIVGVSITPGIGLEVAQVDFERRTVLKYGSKPLSFDVNKSKIIDMDLFKNAIEELFTELQILPKSDVVLSMPTPFFNITEYPAAQDNTLIHSLIEDDLSMHDNTNEDVEYNISDIVLPNSTIQTKRVIYCASYKDMLCEIVYQMNDLGYNITVIDATENSTLNALLYNERISLNPDIMTTVAIIENNYVKLLALQGRCYVESLRMKIAIGEVLGADENYRTVADAMQNYINKIPSQYLYILSKTDIISASVLASKLNYKGTVLYQEQNILNGEPFMNCDPSISEENAKKMSVDVIGAAITAQFAPYSSAKLNLFNKYLGTLYTDKQPLMIGNYELSVKNMVVLAITVALFMASIVFIYMFISGRTLNEKKLQEEMLDKKIAAMNDFISKNSHITGDRFSESDQIQIGLSQNKDVYTYYTIVGTEIPQKLWLTSLELGKDIVIEGQADNVESIYSFFRNIRDYEGDGGNNRSSGNLKLQSLGLASKTDLGQLSPIEGVDTDVVLNSMNADFYQFVIANKKIVKANKKGGKAPNELPPLN